MKREIRCKSGAIPVAVNPRPLLLRFARNDGGVEQPDYSTTVPIKSVREGDRGWGKPEDLPGHKQSFNAFG